MSSTNEMSGGQAVWVAPKLVSLTGAGASAGGVYVGKDEDFKTTTVMGMVLYGYGS